MKCNRREVLQLLGAIPIFGILRGSEPRVYGYMDVDRWAAEGHRGKSVLCNGVDITDRCRSFDDRIGEAEVLRDVIHDPYDAWQTIHGEIKVTGYGRGQRPLWRPERKNT